MKNFIIRLFKEEEGQGMVEYSLLIAAIAIVLFVGYKALGNALDEKLKAMFKALTGTKADW